MTIPIDGRTRIAPVTRPPAEQPTPEVTEAQLDRRAQRNLQNLEGGSNFSSSSLPAVQRRGQISPTDQARGVDAFRAIDSIRNGVETRRMALDGANDRVRDAEARLATQLGSLQPSMTRDQLQAYADDYRRTTPAYGDAARAAEDLAGFMRDNAARLSEAHANLHLHPRADLLQGEGARSTEALSAAAGSLDRFVSQSPTGSQALQRMINEASQGLTVPAGAAIGGTGFAIGQLGNVVSRFSDVANRAAGAFGAVAGVVNGANNLERLLQDGRAEHAAGLLGNTAQVVGGVLRIGGVAIGSTVGIVGTLGALAAQGVSAYRDNERTVAEVSARLGRLGLTPTAADTLARANPEALRTLQAQGFSPDHLQRLAGLGQSLTLRAHESSASAFAVATQRLGLSPEAATQFMERLGSRAGQGAALLERIIAGNPRATSREAIMQELGFRQPLVSDETRLAVLAALGS